MLSRKTTMSLAEVYDAKFGGFKQDYTLRTVYFLNTAALYDFLYENDYDVWFMNAVKSLVGYEGELRGFIMGLHTGETIEPATSNWTCRKGLSLGRDC